MCKAIVIGTSFGGLEALKTILPQFEGNFPIPIIIVLHIGDHNNDAFIGYLNDACNLIVKEAEGNEPIRPGYVYFAPPNYHLLIEDNFTFSLSTDEKQNHSRPSIDVLFESAAWAYRNSLAGVVLTGANSDGANGLRIIKSFGGKTIIQDPEQAIAPIMPRFAQQIAQPDHLLNLDEIADKLIELGNGE